MPSLSEPLRLPCGQVLPNRLAKAAMTEGLGDPFNRATERHVKLYRRWAAGGLGLMLTGNIQIDRRHLERPGNVAIEGKQTPEQMTALKAWTSAAKAGGAQVWAQVSHAGRQTPKAVNPTPSAPSAVKLALPGGQFGEPRALTGDEIQDIVNRFARTSSVAREAGFSGVQIHSAHGYLLSEFLSPRVNLRTDEWGGSLENRARLLLETIKAVRAATGSDFAISVKLNSADFQKGGFTNEECLKVVDWLNGAGIDLLEISGGNYEQPKMAGLAGIEAASEEKVRESTRAREAYFIDYAAAISKVARMPLMVTGGFRTRAGMEEALTSGATHVIGIGRPLCGDPLAGKRLLNGETQALPSYEKTLRIGPGWLGPNSPLSLFKMINGWGAQGWYCLQLIRMGDGLDPDLRMSVLQAFQRYASGEAAAAKAMSRAA
ncbi:MAG: NADH:flavin oxidoreductase/NADH oxidase family protein [Alphaproteobacteria bacterium]|nr:NADH:flavin oxidoreductase/NADH oxidase family protein [Alphaproteobacteria bacterium]